MGIRSTEEVELALGTELRLPVVPLPGLSPDSLGNYLASLGLLRVMGPRLGRRGNGAGITSCKSRV